MCEICSKWVDFGVSIVDFEQVNTGWKVFLMHKRKLSWCTKATISQEVWIFNRKILILTEDITKYRYHQSLILTFFLLEKSTFNKKSTFITATNTEKKFKPSRSPILILLLIVKAVTTPLNRFYFQWVFAGNSSLPRMSSENFY